MRELKNFVPYLPRTVVLLKLEFPVDSKLSTTVKMLKEISCRLSSNAIPFSFEYPNPPAWKVSEKILVFFPCRKLLLQLEIMRGNHISRLPSLIMLLSPNVLDLHQIYYQQILGNSPQNKSSALHGSGDHRRHHESCF